MCTNWETDDNSCIKGHVTQPLFNIVKYDIFIKHLRGFDMNNIRIKTFFL